MSSMLPDRVLTDQAGRWWCLPDRLDTPAPQPVTRVFAEAVRQLRERNR